MSKLDPKYPPDEEEPVDADEEQEDRQLPIVPIWYTTAMMVSSRFTTKE